jgi:phosphoserine phosphatase RsbU/P
MQYRYFIVATFLQIPLWVDFGAAVSFLKSHFHVQEVSTSSGVRTAGAATLILVIASYSLFVRFLRGEGQESFRLRNELEPAHGIQKTLVPPVTMRTKTFEIYGRSDPSEKVGGDLVDVVQLEDGSTVAYLADIASHGLQAGILMGVGEDCGADGVLSNDLANSQVVNEFYKVDESIPIPMIDKGESCFVR